MLKGRESLVRLVGRRRRSPLPASLAAALLSSPAPTHQVKTLNPKPLLPMSFALYVRRLTFPPFPRRPTTRARARARRPMLARRREGATAPARSGWRAPSAASPSAAPTTASTPTSVRTRFDLQPDTPPRISGMLIQCTYYHIGSLVRVIAYLGECCS
jgi:hypothetical protein